jgi:hypothetical protein
MCLHESGQASVHEHHYVIQAHLVVLDGSPDEVLRRDAEELLGLPGGLYRLPTPGEQEAWMTTQRNKGMIQEGGTGC